MHGRVTRVVPGYFDRENHWSQLLQNRIDMLRPCKSMCSPRYTWFVTRSIAVPSSIGLVSLVNESFSLPIWSKTMNFVFFSLIRNPILVKNSFMVSTSDCNLPSRSVPLKLHWKILFTNMLNVVGEAGEPCGRPCSLCLPHTQTVYDRSEKTIRSHFPLLIHS
jgi:hypothetical protein